MGKKAKKWLIAAASLVVLGMIILVLTAHFADWDFIKFDTGRYETNTYEVNQEFINISIKTDIADVVFAPSDDEICKVVCYEDKNMKHTVSVVDDELTVNVVDTRKWYEFIGINFRTQKITIYLPESEYSSLIIKESTGDIEIPNDFKFNSINVSVSTGNVKSNASATEEIKISTSTGDINLEEFSVNSLNLSVSTGKITVSDATCKGDVTVSVSTGKAYLTGVSCKNVISIGDTGDIYLNNVIALEKFSIKRDTGDVSFERCDATEIFVETDTGDVKGSLLSEKIFIVNTDTGKKVFPNTTTGGRCEITTDTGDISLEIADR